MTGRTGSEAVTSVTAFFPCYNDSGVIADLVTRVSATLDDIVDDYEVIVVDDGSEDDSVAVLRSTQGNNTRLRVVEHGVNRGYGAALRSGFAAASKDWVFYTDGDGQYDPTEVRHLVRAAGDDLDFVQGWKISRGDSMLRRVVGRLYHHTVKLLFGLRVRDTDCDFRLMRRTLLEKVELEYNSGVICVEMMRKFRDAGATFAEVPVNHYERPVGTSQFFQMRRVAKSLWDLVRLWLDIVVRGEERRGRHRAT